VLVLAAGAVCAGGALGTAVAGTVVVSPLGCFAAIGLATVGLATVGLAKLGTAKVGLANIGLAGAAGVFKGKSVLGACSAELRTGGAGALMNGCHSSKAVLILHAVVVSERPCEQRSALQADAVYTVLTLHRILHA
jgi:hypothetical protein